MRKFIKRVEVIIGLTGALGILVSIVWAVIKLNLFLLAKDDILPMLFFDSTILFWLGLALREMYE